LQKTSVKLQDGRWRTQINQKRAKKKRTLFYYDELGEIMQMTPTEIRQARRALGLTQLQLSKRLGLHGNGQTPTTGETKMATFKNINWAKRDHEITNVIYQVTASQPRNLQTGIVDLVNWKEVDATEAQEIADWKELGGEYLQDAKGMKPLGRVDDCQFWGFL